MSFADIIMPVVGVLLLCVNFFFVLAEFALVRVRASRIAEIRLSGTPKTWSVTSSLAFHR